MDKSVNIHRNKLRSLICQKEVCFFIDYSLKLECALAHYFAYVKICFDVSIIAFISSSIIERL